MKDFAGPEIVRTLVTLGAVGLSASLAVWGWMIGRVLRRRAVLPYQPRRPVPWQAIDLLLIYVFYLLVAGAIVESDRVLFPQVAAPLAPDARLSTEHDVLVLLREERSVGTFLLCVLAAVIVAPVTEEVFFRLLLQGWLERMERRWRHALGFVRGMLRGFLPILGSSVAFAVLHSRRESVPLSAQTILHLLVCSMLVKLATMAFALVLVRFRAGATCVDLGISRRGLLRDVGLGLGAAVAVVPWVYLLQLLLGEILPKRISPDPFTLVPFAVVLGLLYFRTHRIVPSIVLHMVLNATSLALAWYALSRGL